MPDTFSQTLREWQNFYLLIGGASAILVGLMLVAISLVSGRLTERSIADLRIFVSPTLIHFVYVLFTASVALIPTMTGVLLGILLLLVGLVSFGSTLRALPSMRRGTRKRQIDRGDWVWYFLGPSASYLLYVGSGIGLLQGGSRALNGLALGSIMLLALGIRNAWDTVIWWVLSKSESPIPEASVGPTGQSESGATRVQQADLAPQPQKEYAEKPSSLALPPSHQADVARIIQEAGLNLSDFTWALQPSRYALIGPLVSAVVHTRTGYFFRFEFKENASGQKRISVFSPGEGGREATAIAASWEEQLAQVRTWVKHLSPRETRPHAPST